MVMGTPLEERLGESAYLDILAAREAFGRQRCTV
jgi:hypothetical protein